MARTKGVTTKATDLTKQVLEKHNKPKTQKTPPLKRAHIPTGCVLLNLACSDSARAGFGLGKMVNLIGDSSSGKSLLAFGMCSDMGKLRQFNKYRMIYDDVEAACEFDLSYLFGAELARRIEPPDKTKEGEDMSSETIQDFKRHVMAALAQDEPFVYILDSFDALTSDEEVKRTSKALKKGEKEDGSYKAEKAKIGGEILRMIIRKLKKTKSLLIIISQTRENLNARSFEKKYRAGGKALKFYATHEIWLAMIGKRKSRNRNIGVDTRAKVSKNKLTGKIREVDFTIYYDYGVDDIGSCIDFMVDEELWPQKKNTIEASDLDLKGTRANLISQIEKGDREGDLFQAVQLAWDEIETSLKLNRKPKYDR